MMVFAVPPGPTGTSAEAAEAMATPAASVNTTVTGTLSNVNLNTLFWGFVPPEA